MYWYRLECGLGRFSVVGTTVRQAELPEHLLADEHHQTLDGQKVYIATTVGAGCVLGAEPADGGRDRRPEGRLRRSSRTRPATSPRSMPPRPSTPTAGRGRKAAWKALFPRVVILLCFLHAWLKIRDRAKHLKELFAEVSRRVWEAYHAPDRRCFGQRLRSAAGVGDGAPERGGPGEGPGPVRRSATAGRSRTATPAATAPATCSTG